MFEKLSYCNNSVRICDPATDNDINNAHFLIKKRIDPSFDPRQKRW